MGKLSRTKGHSFERQVAQWFQDAGWPEARRQLEYHVKDALGVDLQGTEPFAVQCKRGQNYAPVLAIEEIQEGVGFAPGQHIPVLITKADHKPAMAVLPAEEFFRLLRNLPPCGHFTD